MAAAMSLDTFQNTAATHPAESVGQDMTLDSPTASTGTAPGPQASATQANSSFTQVVAGPTPTTNACASPTITSPTPTKCRHSKAIQCLHQCTTATWKGIAALVLTIVGLVLTIYYGVVQYNSAQASNILAQQALRYTVWTAENDFRQACASDLESGRPLSAACKERLAEPAWPPPVKPVKMWRKEAMISLGFELPPPTIILILAIFLRQPHPDAGSRRIAGPITSITHAMVLCVLIVGDDRWAWDPSLLWLTCMSWLVILTFHFDASVNTTSWIDAITIARFCSLVFVPLAFGSWSETTTLVELIFGSIQVLLCILWRWETRGDLWQNTSFYCDGKVKGVASQACRWRFYPGIYLSELVQTYRATRSVKDRSESTIE